MSCIGDADGARWVVARRGTVAGETQLIGCLPGERLASLEGDMFVSRWENPSESPSPEAECVRVERPLAAGVL